MFDFLYEWIQNLAFYLVMAAAVLHAVPGGSYKKYVRFFTGLVLILMLLTPLLKVFGTDIDIAGLYDKEEYEMQVEKFTDMAEDIETEAAGEGTEEEEKGRVEVEEIRID